MKRTILLFYLSLVYCICYCQTPANDQNWDSNNLILQDDFTGTTLNTNLWNAINGNWNPNFDFVSANVTVNNSSGLNCLNLSATNGNTSGKPVHCGGIIAKNSTGCGYYEVRCRIATMGAGYNTAFWIFDAVNFNCPTACNSDCWYKEIDFFEALCNPHQFNISSNAHYWKGNCNENNGVDFYLPYVVNGDALYNEFHTYGYEWTPTRVIFYLDGRPYRYLNSSLIDNTPLKLWINIGSNGSAADCTFPGYFYIDYVKVFNLKRNCIDENITNFNSSTYNNYSVKNTISIGGTSNVDSNTTATLRAQNGITITGDFTVALGGELTLLQTSCY